MSANTEYSCAYCKKVTVVSTSDIANSKDIKVVYYVTFDGKYVPYCLCSECYNKRTIGKQGCYCSICDSVSDIIIVTPNTKFTNIFKLCRKCFTKYVNIVKTVNSQPLTFTERYNRFHDVSPKYCSICNTAPDMGLLICYGVDIFKKVNDTDICYACYAKMLLTLQHNKQINIHCCQYCCNLDSTDGLYLCRNQEQQYTVLCRKCKDDVNGCCINLQYKVQSTFDYCFEHPFNVRVFNIYHTLTHSSLIPIELTNVKIIINKSITLSIMEKSKLYAIDIGYAIYQLDIMECLKEEADKYFEITDGKIMSILDTNNFLMIGDLVIIKSNGEDDSICRIDD